MENLPQDIQNMINATLFPTNENEETYLEAERRGKTFKVEAKQWKKKFKAQNVDESAYVEDTTSERFVTVIGTRSVMIELNDIVFLKKPSVMPSCFGPYESVLITNDVADKYGKKKIVECLRVLDIAHTKFIKAGQELNWKYELEYMKMYECMRDNQELWFEGILIIDGHNTFALNYPIAERLTSLLGTYCLILRQRGDIKMADLITKTVYTRSLDRHLAMAMATERKDVIAASDSMRYKYNQIKCNLAFQHHREEEYAPLCRKLLKFELANFFDFDQSIYLLFIGNRGLRMWKEDMSEKEKKKLDQELKAYQESLPFHLQMKLSRSHIPYVSQAILDRMPDEAIVYSLGTTIYMYQNDRPNPKFDKLRKCDACGKTERAMKEFKKILECQASHSNITIEHRYCSSKCQKDAWKVIKKRKPHKKCCKKLRGSREKSDAKQQRDYDRFAYKMQIDLFMDDARKEVSRVLEKLSWKYVSPVPGVTSEQKKMFMDFIRGPDVRRMIRVGVDAITKSMAKRDGDDGVPLSYKHCEHIAEETFKNIRGKLLSHARDFGISAPQQPTPFSLSTSSS